VAGPLTNLLKNDAFKWSDQATEAFLNLKQTLAQAPVLTVPDFSHLFVFETNASGTGIGAILSQQDIPSHSILLQEVVGNNSKAIHLR